MSKNKKEKQKKSLGMEILSWVLTIAAAIGIALLVRAFIFEPIRVDGKSMTNTLQNGEILYASKIDYLLGDVQRGDVVICHYPNRRSKGILGIESDTCFVKRLVALPGDTVEIADGKLYVNDELVEDPEKMGSVPNDFEKITLGEDQYFVIGDNRGNSHDSRSRDVGPISRSAIVAKVRFVFWPLNAIRGVQ